MPSRPRTPRAPRVSPSRRPRVAGLAPANPTPDPGESDVSTRGVERSDTPPAPAPAASDPTAPAARPGPPRPEAARTGSGRPDAAEARSVTEPPAGRAPEPTPRPPSRPTPRPTARPAPRPTAARTGRARLADAPPAADEAPTVVPVRKQDRRTPDGAPARPRPRPRPAAPTTDRSAAGSAADPADDPAAAPSRVGNGLPAALQGRAVPLLAAALVVLAGVAVLFGVQDARLRGTPAATNSALVDVGATAEAAGQLSDAIETIYSFDFARLDENRNAAREVITPAFAEQFERLFAEVQARAPQQQAVVSATVTLSAVKELRGDRAVLVAFVDQQATRAAPDAQSQQLAAAGRLTVIGERVDGRWKIAAVTPL